MRSRTAILVIYLVLGILNDSFAHPVTILSGLPSEGFGALVTLLFLIELNVYAFVGLIMVIGIVKKNAIRRSTSRSTRSAARGSCRSTPSPRAASSAFRPIMMTTNTALPRAPDRARGLGPARTRVVRSGSRS